MHPLPKILLSTMLYLSNRCNLFSVSLFLFLSCFFFVSFFFSFIFSASALLLFFFLSLNLPYFLYSLPRSIATLLPKICISADIYHFSKGISAIIQLSKFIIKPPSKKELKTTIRYIWRKTGIPMVCTL